MVVDSALAQILWIPSASGSQVPIDSLRSSLNPDEATVLVPKDAKFNETLISFNKRTTVTPAVRVLCRTPESVAVCIQWAKQNNVPLAMRNGGHSYEGFSQSAGIVIDVRMMDSIGLNDDGSQATIGAGAVLGRVYEAIANKGRVIPAGSCPTVGVTGHTTGGGYGLLARPFGLAADSLTQVEMVNAQGQLLTVNATENADLFWAIRGGGGGNLGIITELQFKTHVTKKVVTFICAWSLKKNVAAQVFKAWQEWAPNAPHGITSLIKFSKEASGTIAVRLVGQTVGTETELTKELKNNIFKVKAPDKYTPQSKAFIDAVKQFSGDKTFPAKLTYPSVYMKGKSDYVKQVISDEGHDVLFTHLPSGIAVIFDSYGGQIRALKDNDTAFPHRENTISSVQYYTEWSKPEDTAKKLKTLSDYYGRLRPYMSGGAYVNYCDVDLKNYAEAYWGGNLARLIDIKAAHDPENIFKHAQSIPVKN